MKGLFSQLTEDDGMIGPGTDLIISLVAVLLMVTAINAVIQKQETENIKKELAAQEFLNSQIKANQMELIHAIATAYDTSPKMLKPNKWGISTRRNRENDILIQNDVTLQRFSFGSHILFESDDTILKPAGIKILQEVGEGFLQKLHLIDELQIQGHADSRPSRKYRSNLELAANRAICVFSLLSEKVGIDPLSHLVSISSFGEYKPVGREASDRGFSLDQLKAANKSSAKRDKNRRIEILLYYRKTVDAYQNGNPAPKR